MYPMRITVALWLVAICIVCVSARVRSDGTSRCGWRERRSSRRRPSRSVEGSCLHLPDGSGCPIAQSRDVPPVWHEPRRGHPRSRRVPSRRGDHPSADTGRTRGRIAVLHPRPMEGPPGQQLQRRAREAVSCIRGQRGSAVLQARAPDAGRRRSCFSFRSSCRRRACIACSATSTLPERRRN